MWLSFWAVFKKELLHILRDRGTLRIALMLPTMQLILFGFIDQTVHDLATVVVDQDRSVESRLLMDQMTASKTFKIKWVTQDPKEGRELIRAGRARVGVVIPPKYHDKRVRGSEAQVLVLIDGSDSTASSQALASINGLIAQNNLEAARAVNVLEGIAAQPVILFNPAGRTANYIIPGLVAILLQFVAVLLAAGAIVRERERGTFEQLLVTPIHPLGLMLGKLGPYLFVAFAEMTVILLLMRFGFQVPIRGSILVLYAMALVYLFALLSLGLLVSTRASTQMEAQQMAQMTVLPSIFLSGYIFPFEGMPFPLRAIGSVLPATHMIAIMRGVVLRNADLIELWPHVAALAAVSVLLVYAGSKSIHKVAT
jgi:ABC-2 type transport system permease protein